MNLVLFLETKASRLSSFINNLVSLNIWNKVSTQMPPMDYFQTLPEECVTEILSLTTPADVARCSAVSKGFKCATESDILWDTFLPSDFENIIRRSECPVPVCATKRELYFTLCESPVLLDGGKLSFSVDKFSGKKCFMVAPRALSISWGSTSCFWQWKTHPNSRFSEVAALRCVCWLDIRGQIGSEMLSPRTNYGAYLVFKLTDRCYGLESVNAIVRFVDHESDRDTEDRASTVCLATSWQGKRHGSGYGQLNGKLPKMREDGWMEVEMGCFNSKKGDDGIVEARLLEIKSLHDKGGLILEGIEFRPHNH